MDHDTARSMVERGATIRVHAGAVGCEDMVMAEGRVIVYCAAPTLTIEHADGTRSSWSTQLPIVEVEPSGAAPRDAVDEFAEFNKVLRTTREGD